MLTEQEKAYLKKRGQSDYDIAQGRKKDYNRILLNEGGFGAHKSENNPRKAAAPKPRQEERPAPKYPTLKVEEILNTLKNQVANHLGQGQLEDAIPEWRANLNNYLENTSPENRTVEGIVRAINNPRGDIPAHQLVIDSSILHPIIQSYVKEKEAKDKDILENRENLKKFEERKEKERIEAGEPLPRDLNKLFTINKSITEPYGPHSVSDLQLQDALKNAVMSEAVAPYQKNPHKTLISLEAQKKADADLMRKLAHPSAKKPEDLELYKKRAEELYNKPSSYEEHEPKVVKALKEKSILKKADKIMAHTPYQEKLNELRENHLRFAAGNLGKLLAPFQTGHMKRHGQTGTIAQGFLENVHRNLAKEERMLHENMREKALAQASQHALAKANARQNMITAGQEAYNQKRLKLADVHDYERRKNQDLDADIERTRKHEEALAQEQQLHQNLKAHEFEAEKNYPKEQIGFVANIANKHPIPHYTEPAPKRPEHGPNAMQTLASGIAGIAGNFSPTHKEKMKGGRLLKADGDLLNKAVENAEENHMGLLKSLKNVSRYDQIKAIEQKMKERQKHKKGQEVTSSPIAEGSRMAKQYALQDRVLEHAERLSQPRERNPVTAILEGLAAGTNDHPYYGHAGKAYLAGREGVKAHEAAEDERANTAVKVQHEIAKQIQEEQKNERHLDNEERHIRAQEAHYKATEAHQRAMETASANKKDPLILKEEFDDYKRDNKEKHEYIENARASYNRSKHIQERLHEIKALAMKANVGETGSLIQEYGGKLGQGLYKATSKVPNSVFRQYHRACEALVRDLEVETKGIHSAARQKLLANAKIMADMPIGAAMGTIESMENEEKKIEQHSLYGINAVKEGLSPVEADISFSQKWEAEHTPKEEIIEEEVVSPASHEVHPPHVHNRIAEIDNEIAHLEDQLKNRKKLGDIISRYPHSDGDRVHGNIWHEMMQIPETRELIHSLYGT